MSHDPTSPAAKFKIPVEERRVRDAERLRMIQLRMAICRKLEDQGINDPSRIGAIFGLKAMDAEKLLIRKHWREGDLVKLEGAAIQLGLQVPGPAQLQRDNADGSHA